MIEVHSDAPTPFPEAAERLAQRYVFDPEVELEIMLSPKVLGPAATKIGFAQRLRLAPSEVIAEMRKRVSVKPLAGGKLFEVTVRSENLERAAALADSVVGAYGNYLIQRRTERNREELEHLERGISLLRDKLEGSRVRMLDIKDAYNVVDLGHDEHSGLQGGSLNTGIATLVMTAQQREFDAGAVISDLRTTIKALGDLSGDEMIKGAIDLGLKNPILATRYPEYQNLLLQRARLVGGGADNKDPKVVAIDKTIVMTHEMLGDAVDTCKRALGTRLAMAEQKYANAKQTKERVEKESLKQSRMNIEYIEAKRSYFLDQRLLNECRRLLAEGRLNSVVRSNPITIHEEPIVNPVPAVPEE